MAIELFENAIYLHDLGKINRNFQILKMNNPELKDLPTQDSNHSIYSSLMYMDIFLNDITSKAFNRKEQGILIKLWLNFAYSISRHHGYLN